METDNSSCAIELRRRRNTLVIAGVGMMLFGAWTVVKTISVLLLGRSVITPELIESFESSGTVYKDNYYYIAILMAAIVVTVDQVFRVYVGLSAVSEGHGRHRTVLYIFIACFFIWSSFSTITGLCMDYGIKVSSTLSGAVVEKTGNILKPDASISSIIIELTSLIMLIELVYSAIRVRILTGRHTKHRKNGEHGK